MQNDTKPNIDRMYNVIMDTVRRHRINTTNRPIGQLFDALATDGGNDDIITYLCQTMHTDVNVNRSTYITPFFEYMKIGIYVNYSTTGTNGHQFIPRHRNEQRKQKSNKSKPVVNVQNKVDKLRGG